MDHLFIGLNLHLDIFSPIGILESIDGLLVLISRRTDSSNHDCLAVTSERVFEHSCQLTVSEWHKRSLFVLVSESVNTICQSKKRCVDFGSLH
jgi:hypothetical protein